MNDVDELKRYMLLHARVQGMSDAQYNRVVSRIGSDDERRPDSWVAQWSQEARSHEKAGRLLDACRRYNLARFPYVDGPARQQAQDKCVAVFDQWRSGHTDIERLDIDCMGGRVGCWTSGLSSTDPRPVVVLMGGTVSIKEQWAPLLPLFRKQGLAAIATEMPGVGENTLRYDPDSWNMISVILDTVADRADVTNCIAACPSFSGHLALHCAARDSRIKGIITAGAPVSRFFTDAAWREGVPRIATDTLAHLTGQSTEDMTDWALDSKLLAELDIPVHYLVSLRDEIVPPDETDVLQEHLSQLHLMANDDVHGSPRHTFESRIWVALSLLRLRGVDNLQTKTFAGLLGLLRARSALAGHLRPRPA